MPTFHSPNYTGLALLRQLAVLKLNSNRLGEECTFNARRMIEKNQELFKALMDPGKVGLPDVNALHAYDLFPNLGVSKRVILRHGVRTFSPRPVCVFMRWVPP